MRINIMNRVLLAVRRAMKSVGPAFPVCALCMACLLAALAMGRGGSSAFQKSIAGSSSTEIHVTAGASGQTLGDAAITSFKAMDGADAVTGVISLPLRIKAGRYTAQSVDVMAVDPAVFAGRLSFNSGEMFTMDSGSSRLVLGYSAQSLFKANTTTGIEQVGQPSPTSTAPSLTWPGQSVEFTAVSQRTPAGTAGDKTNSSSAGWVYSGQITGVLAQDTSERNGKALMSLAAAKKILRENHALAVSLNLKANAYTSAIVFAKDIGNIPSIIAEITAMGYSAVCAVPDLTGLQDKLALQQTILLVIGIFSVLTAVFAMAYAMMRKNPGQRPLYSDAAIAGFLCGVAGVLLGCFFALMVNTSTAETVLFRMHFGQQNNLIIPYYMALETVGVSLLAGFSAGWLAGRIPPGQISNA